MCCGAREEREMLCFLFQNNMVIADRSKQDCAARDKNLILERPRSVEFFSRMWNGASLQRDAILHSSC